MGFASDEGRNLVSSIGFSDNGTSIYCVYGDGTIQVWNTQLAPENELRIHLDLVEQAAAKRNAGEALRHRQTAQGYYNELLTQHPKNELLINGLANLLLKSTDNWTLLRPNEMKSEGGATLTLQADGSIAVSGNNPDSDTYTITVDVDLPRVTALRLEALPDASLPRNGPGRSSGGNFHLTELEVAAAPREASAQTTPVAFARVTTDYLRDGNRLLDAVDGDPNTRWDVFPQIGIPHILALEPAKPISNAKKQRLIVKLHCEDPDQKQHGLGRFRLAIANAPLHPQYWLVRALLNGPVESTVSPRTRLGCAYFLTGEPDEAIEILARSAEQTSTSRGYDLFVLALANHRLSHTEEADQWYARALDWIEYNETDNSVQQLARAAMVAVGGQSPSNADKLVDQLRKQLPLNLALELKPRDPPPKVIIPAGSTWRWLHPVDGVDPAEQDDDFHTSFYTTEYDDSSWQSGQDSGGPTGGFGYGDPSGVSIGEPATGDRKTAYLRHRFRADEGFDKLALSMQRDDGVIVYLDGAELLRDNIAPRQPEAYDLFAERSVTEGELKVFPLAEGLEPGDHVLTISLHNHSADSSDLRIAEISLWGTRKED